MADWSSYLDDKEECPTCGEICESELGVQVHHARRHGEYLRETRACVFCGQEFEVPTNHQEQKYCSQDCFGRSNAQAQKAKRPRSSCEHCGRTFRTKPSKEASRRFCSVKCSNEAQKDQVEIECAECGGEFKVMASKATERAFCSVECVHSAQEKRSEIECVECGSPFEVTPAQASKRTFCSVGCVYEHQREEQENVPRRGVFWKEQRKRCLSRDDYTCQACGEQRAGLQIHHIVPARNFERGEEEAAHALSNLVTLCPPCHGNWEGLFLRPDTRPGCGGGEEASHTADAGAE